MRKLINWIPVFILMGTCTVYSCQSTRSSTTSRMLKFGFQQGHGYDYEMIMNMDQDVMGQKMQMDMTNYYSMDVTADNGTTKNITTTFERVKMNMGLGGMNIEIDSDKPLPEFGGDKGGDAMKKLNGVLGAIKGKKFSMVVNEDGKILEVTGFKDMAISIVDSLGIDEKQKDEMAKKFDEQFNEQNIKDQFGRVFYIFPNKEVKVGDTWQKKLTIAGMAGGNYVSDYTVEEIEGDMVTIAEKTTITSGNEDQHTGGEMKGTIVVDSKTGLVVNADQDMKLTTTRNGSASKMIIKTKIKGKAR